MKARVLGQWINETRARAPPDEWYRQEPDDEPGELTFVHEDTFCAEF